MCDPVSIAVASAGFQFVTQMQQADAAESSARAANQANMDAYATQQKQINAAATDEMSDRAREAMIQRGKLRVLAAESGLTGASQLQQERQSQFDEGFDLSRIEGNRKNAQNQSYLDAQAGRAQNQSRINSIKQPSLVGAGLQIAGAYYDEQAQEKRLDRLTGKYGTSNPNVS